MDTYSTKRRHMCWQMESLSRVPLQEISVELPVGLMQKIVERYKNTCVWEQGAIFSTQRVGTGKVWVNKRVIKGIVKECQKKELHVESAESMSLTIAWRPWGVIGGIVAVLFCLFFIFCKKKKKNCVNTILELHLWTSFLWEHSINKGKNHTPFKMTLLKSEFLC